MVDAVLRSLSSMRPALAFLIATASLGMAAAHAQSQTLIDPATGQPRYVPPLLDPSQFRGPTAAPRPGPAGAAIAPASEPPRLRHQPVAEAPPPPKREHVASPPKAAKPAPVQTAKTQPQKSPPPASSTLAGFDDLQVLTLAPSKPAAKPAAQPAPTPKVAKTEPPPSKPEPVRHEPVKQAPAKPVREASIAPAKTTKARSTAGLKDSIAFAPNASDPSGAAVAAVRTLSTSLGSALNDPNARIQLMAYAGQRGQKTSDTRRLSLKRALVVRQLLIDDGVPSERIDVFALGGTDDDGPADRVDVMVKG